MDEEKDLTIAAQNQMAEKIEAEAKQWAQANPVFTQQIELLKKKGDTNNSFFVFFLDCVKEGEHLKVSYILNFCFDSPESRANFGNRQDSDGNTAYHHAARLGHDEIITILNDERPRNGKVAKMRFVLKNKEGKKPLELVCEHAHKSTFDLIWARAGKSNHNPCYAIKSARMGGNVEIIAAIEQHPKFTKKISLAQGVAQFGLQPAPKTGAEPPSKKARSGDDKEEFHDKRVNPQ